MQTGLDGMVAIVTDGTAVLGLGDIGPRAALPVMEGKALLFKQFGGIDAVPICLDTTDVDQIVETVVRIAPGFGGINLEDIAAPRCFEIEKRLRASLDIPVFHDDQHGTAIVVLAALTNAARGAAAGVYTAGAMPAAHDTGALAGEASVSPTAANVGAALGSAALLWLAFDQRFEHVPLRWVFMLALLVRVIAALASSPLVCVRTW